MKKYSYERRVYESIDEKSLSWNIYFENQRKTEFVQQRVEVLCSKNVIIWSLLKKKHSTMSIPGRVILSDNYNDRFYK